MRNALGHATREAIFGEFGNGPATLATIALEMKIPIATVNYHVLVLVQEGRLTHRGHQEHSRVYERARTSST
jgi:DNA-binding IclR family transcriptional regulator